ncbi:type II toxin-antitoxin system prevent-host-death family antitoxin [Corynebacterium sp. A21]|uniref:type II toxin-antitoxin system prevent-host-death family antitoxin n=1 Tax=Corynebacterium sp. A21 TaxID=3457318 RepID=UPI003FD3B872
MHITVSLSEFRSEQSRYLDVAQREPVEILSRGTRRRAVVVSPDFYDRAVQALEDVEDIRAAATARQEAGGISHTDLKAELGLD